MILHVVGWLARLWVALSWLAMALVAGLLLVLFWPLLRALRPEHRRGIAPAARDDWQPTPPGVGQWTAFSLDPKRGDEDQVAKGLGCVRPPRCHRASPSRTTPYLCLPADEQELWFEAVMKGRM